MNVMIDIPDITCDLGMQHCDLRITNGKSFHQGTDTILENGNFTFFTITNHSQTSNEFLEFINAFL